MPKHIQDPRLIRLDHAWLRLPNPWNIPVEVCAGPDIPIEPAAVDEILTVLQTADTLRALAEATPGYSGPEPRITRVALTPDLHKGAGIPIGTVIETKGALLPKAVGSDINCGMRLEITSLTIEQVRNRLDALEARLRYVFFEGGRQIALRPEQRRALLRDGLPGLLESGTWGDADHERARMHAPSFAADGVEAFADWVNSAGGTSFDSIIGSVGGGNHFAELQYVSRVHDPQAAYAWGLRPGTIVTMTHSGSLSLGHQANATAADRARTLWPTTLARPANGILPLLLNPPDERPAKALAAYLEAFGNAANFAAGNRFFLSHMMRTALADECGKVSARLLYDAPHNLFWQDGQRVVHRKGATPAGGYTTDGAAAGPYGMWGEPVIVPGSMGASSFVLRGTGNPRTLASACHGAGRRVPRGAASRGNDTDLDAFLREFRVVTPLDHRSPAAARRPDVMAAWRRDLKQEAPWVYKDIGPVVASLQAGDVAHPVAELRPLMTVKG